MPERSLRWTGRSWGVLAGSALAIAGGAGCLVKAWLIYSGDLSWPGGSRASFGAGICALLGVVGVTAALSSPNHAGRAAQAEALAGIVAIVFDLGAARLLPRIAPGLLLLAAAAVTFAGRWRTAPRKAASELDQLCVWVGFAAHAVVGALFAAIGLAVPAPGVLAVYAIWGLFLGGALLLRRSHPRLVPLAPVAAFAAMWGLVLVGSRSFGWSP